MVGSSRLSFRKEARVYINNAVICSNCGMRAPQGSQANSFKCSWCSTLHTSAGKRGHERVQKKIKGTLKHKKGGKPIVALTENISLDGAMIRYSHNSSITKNTLLYFYSDSLQIHKSATVVWTNSLDAYESQAGLRFI